MGKNVKLNSKQQKNSPEKEHFFFFVKDQGTGAVRVVVIILKILEIILTTIYGLCLGVFAPLYIRFGMDDPEIAADPSSLVWLISSALYIVGLFVVMLGHSRIAVGVHGIAAVGTLITYSLYTRMFSEVPDNNGPSALYMPCLFITVLTVTIMLLINMPKWIENHVRKANEQAPSILGDNDGSKE